MSKDQDLPEQGDIVITSVKQVIGHGAYVILEEYGNMTGFLHISEIATGWIRNIERYVKPNQKIVLKVIRVSKSRSEVDLSLKQVSGEERKSKILEVKKNEKGNAFLQMIKSKSDISSNEINIIEEQLLSKYDYVYDAFEDVAKKGIDILKQFEFSDSITNLIEEESNKIQIPHVEIRGILEVSFQTSNGIELIKSLLHDIEHLKGSNKIKITYIAAPKYRLVVTADNFKSAEKTIKNIIQKFGSSVEKEHGTFNFIRQESKKTHS